MRSGHHKPRGCFQMLLNYTTTHGTILQQHGSAYVHTDSDMNCISKLSRDREWQPLLATRTGTEGKRTVCLGAVAVDWRGSQHQGHGAPWGWSPARRHLEETL